MQSAFVYTPILSFAFGIALQDIFGFNTAFAVFLLVLGVVLLIITRFSKLEVVRTHGAVLVMAVLAVTCGSVRMGFAQEATNKVVHVYNGSLGSHITFSGVVIDEPDIREYTTNLIIETQDAVRILVKARPHQFIMYGDALSVHGVLEKPENFTGDTGRVFDYEAYLAKDGIHYLVRYPDIEVASHGHGGTLTATLISIKQHYIDTLNNLIPEPQAALAAGITVGAKRALGSELMDAFRNTGLIHIVVLSGFNITIIVVFLLRMFAWLPRGVQYSLATLAVVLFAILTSADAPVVRASAMGILGVTALTLGRTYAITRALLLVALGMVLWNPYILLHDIAFQLSVVATLGLIFFAPSITGYLKTKFFTSPKAYWLAEIVGVTVAAQIAVLPLLIIYMGEVSVVAVIVNVLALPVIPIAMLFAFITGCVGMVAGSIALPFAYVTYGLLAYIVMLVEFFNELPMTTVQIF